jgi:hypothetical protein
LHREAEAAKRAVPNTPVTKEFTVAGARQVKVSDFGRFALSTCVVAALLAGCGGSQPPVSAQSAMWRTVYNGNSLAHQKTFHYIHSKQTFEVPAKVTEITVVARGAAGASGSGGRAATARGGRTFAIIPVTPGEKLVVFVGGDGDVGGYNGGGAGGSSGRCHCTAEYSGGGASDVRQNGDALADRVVVAAGGGGAGGFSYGYNRSQLAGGAGGGLTGGAGSGYPSGHAGGGGGGGTQNTGGSGGSGGSFYRYSGEPGATGVPGQGGAGGSGGNSSYAGGAGGGGGGGGYYGGGGGGAGGGQFRSYCYGCQGGGGGGGSSYIEPGAKKARTWSHWKNARGNGLIVFSWQ